MDFNSVIQSRVDVVQVPLAEGKTHTVSLLREDLIHPTISGNKWRKLKYHLREAEVKGVKRLVTFGGAFSNHIAATAVAGKVMGYKTTGIIRGEELGVDNPTLIEAQGNGMEFHFVSRSRYRDDKSGLLRDLGLYMDAHVIPEGGADELGVKGCEEILYKDLSAFGLVCCSAGTGSTAAGLLRHLRQGQSLRVYSALKGDFLKRDILDFTPSRSHQLQFTDAHCFGGYAKYTDELLEFILRFYELNQIRLDPIYTAKMLYGISRDLLTGDIPSSDSILAIHTGGLQGVQGFEQKSGRSLYIR